MISLKLKDILSENSTMNLACLIFFSNGTNVISKIVLFILYPAIKIPSQFYDIHRNRAGFLCLFVRFLLK